jgi:hypothetical protein
MPAGKEAAKEEKVKPKFKILADKPKQQLFTPNIVAKASAYYGKFMQT